MKFPKRGRVVLEGPEYKAWTRRIFARDGYRCRRCGKKRWLNVHHMISRSEIRLDIDSNGITLCGGDGGCHDLVEKGRVLVIGDDAVTAEFRVV